MRRCPLSSRCAGLGDFPNLLLLLGTAGQAPNSHWAAPARRTCREPKGPLCMGAACAPPRCERGLLTWKQEQSAKSCCDAEDPHLPGAAGPGAGRLIRGGDHGRSCRGRDGCGCRGCWGPRRSRRGRREEPQVPPAAPASPARDSRLRVAAPPVGALGPSAAQPELVAETEGTTGDPQHPKSLASPLLPVSLPLRAPRDGCRVGAGKAGTVPSPHPLLPPSLLAFARFGERDEGAAVVFRR